MFDFHKTKAFLFDMDGVLFDSMPSHARAWEEAFAQIGIEFKRYEAYLQEGRTGASTINDVFRKLYNRDATEKEINELYHVKTSLFESYGQACIMPGAPEALKAVKDADKEICVVTGSGQVSLLETLGHYFPGYFEKNNLVSAFDVKIGKPNPEPYLMALKKMNVCADEAVVIENAPLGVQAGVAAGIFTIAVNTGILKDEELLSQGAGMLFKSMHELADYINGMAAK